MSRMERAAAGAKTGAWPCRAVRHQSLNFIVSGRLRVQGQCWEAALGNKAEEEDWGEELEAPLAA